MAKPVINDIHKNPSVFKHLLGAVGVVIAILLGFVLGLWVGDKHRQEPTPEVQLGLLSIDSLPLVDTLPPVDTVAVQEQEEEVVPEISESTKRERAEGINYLTKHNRWNRDEMEKIPVLKGLWDAVNHYNVEEIRKYAEIMECPPLTTIIEGLEASQKTGYYASKNDRNSTLSTYIRRLQQ